MSDEIKPIEDLEQRLHRRKLEYDALSIPEAATQQAVQAGIRKATRQRKSRLRWMMSSVSAAAIILIFTGCIRVSPAFASFVEQLPGMDSIVSLIRQDKGLMMAIDQSLLQKVGITDEHNGTSVTIEGVITDESRMVIFYTMKGIQNPKNLMYDIKLLDKDGKDLPVGFSYGYTNPTSDEDFHENMINVSFIDSLPPQELTVVFKERKEADANEWRITFPVDHSLTQGMKRVIPVNETLVVDGQQINVNQATLYPTRLVLDMTYDPKNTKKIFGIDDLQLVDEQGRVWTTKEASLPEDGMSAFFESMYFSIPKKLTLHASGIRAVDKDKLHIQIDPTSGKIEGGPQNLKFLKKEIKGKDMILHFNITDSENANSGLSFTNIKDRKGKSLEVSQLGWSPSVAEASVTIKNGASAQGALDMELFSYPVLSQSPFSVDIPVNP
ncbi:hypothetical protein ASD24_10570 [Paenibacillus sp. Root52]|uniref:DUF4179 domain-containing protein n=1 Tax=Paenibacillus sp. Root52 TaxID=1736552 RepID=UPI00070174CF|nr:DUF4179 domain-containing protein [Paenibacillus sp. Root52]KQY84209.1 hypothetical protein ASD24_10570 [Paenibacillus sp. Root52]